MPVTKAVKEVADDYRHYSDYRVATERLRELGPAPEVADLVALLGDGEWLVRVAAANAIGQLGPEAAPQAAALAAALTDDSIDVRCGAAEALGNIGPEAASQAAKLTPLLADTFEMVRKAAKEALEKMQVSEEEIKAKKMRQRRQKARSQKKLKKLGLVSNVNCKGYLQLQFQGAYAQNGETKPTSYNLNISSSGWVAGNARDADGEARVTGKLVWPDGQPFGQIAWEEKGSVTLKASGTISEGQPGCYAIEAQYVSSFKNTHGTTQGQSLPTGATTIVTGTVVGQPMETNK